MDVTGTATTDMTTYDNSRGNTVDTLSRQSIHSMHGVQDKDMPCMSLGYHACACKRRACHEHGQAAWGDHGQLTGRLTGCMAQCTSRCAAHYAAQGMARVAHSTARRGATQSWRHHSHHDGKHCTDRHRSGWHRSHWHRSRRYGDRWYCSGKHHGARHRRPWTLDTVDYSARACDSRPPFTNIYMYVTYSLRWAYRKRRTQTGQSSCNVTENADGTCRRK